MASNDLIVLTGATGFLGFRVLVTALKAGYRVRIVVRSESKVSKVLATPSVKSINPSSEQLSWTVVPDITVPGAYDQAVKGATYVIHCASPIPTFGDEAVTPEQYEKYFVETARVATVGLLESIQKAGTVKRVVITSSAVAHIPFKYFIGQGDDRVFTAEDRIPVAPGPYSFEFEAYSASKAAALNESEAWIAKNKPAFDLVTILPGWIWGRDELATTASDYNSGSTNSVLLGMLKGGQSEIPFNGNGSFVDDVAQLHVSALNPKVKGNQAFSATSDGVKGMVWEDGIKYIQKYFPQAVADGRLSAAGKQPTLPVYINPKKTEETFGIKMAGYEEQIRSLVGHYLEVAQA